MIRKLTLTNWRNYEHVEVDLGPGTTFVVASNGVGKTSLVEAARFALFDAPSTDSASPIRAGMTDATVRIELALPTGQVITIERTLAMKKPRPASSVIVTLDGVAINDATFEVALGDSYRAETAFLARLTMPATSRVNDVPTSLGLEEHLGRFFGVDGLQKAIEVLTANVKSTEKQIREVKVGNAATARQLAELESEITAAATTVQTATTEHAAAKAAHDSLLAEQKALETHATWSAKRDRWMTQAAEMLEIITEELQEQVHAAEVEDRLQQTIDQANSRLENARIQLAVHRSRADFIRTNQASLDASERDCPVCRRPLDEETIATAHRSNDADLEALEAEAQTLQEEEAVANEQRDRAQSLLRRWQRMPDPGPEPDVVNRQTISSEDLETAAQQVTIAFDRLVGLRASEVDAKRRLEAARDADEAMRTLENLFRSEAELRVALSTTTQTRDEILEHTVRPLATEVNQRWADLFPGRGALSTRADANMTRNVNGHPLPFDAFSTGESIGATIVLRLLVAQMATTVDFCWFDEPLEHLDPDVRRQVANILAGATSGGSSLRQVVVTTYEEPLARALQARAPEDVHLVDVRPAPVNPVATRAANSLS